MYLTHDEYKALGGTADHDSFSLLEFKARKRIDYLTDCRVQRMAEVPEAVKLCMTSMINLESKLGIDAQTDSPQVSSFSTDGYTETYAKSLSVDDVQREQDKLVSEMLYGEADDDGIPLLFRGLF